MFLNPALPSPPPAIYAPPNQGTEPPAVNGQLGPEIPCVAAGTCSPLSSLPPWTVPGVSVNPLATTGDYNFTSYFADHLNDYACNTSDNVSCQPREINYADPYYGGRGPQYISYNFSIQKMINKKAVLSVAYAGSQTHFLPYGAGRGYATNTPSPDISQEYKGDAHRRPPSGFAVPYPLFAGSQALLYQALRPFPQFASMTDLWGDTGNANYNSLQVSVIQRAWHNLSGFANYTRAKTIDDTGNHRTQYGRGPAGRKLSSDPQREPGRPRFEHSQPDQRHQCNLGLSLPLRPRPGVLRHQPHHGLLSAEAGSSPASTSTATAIRFRSPTAAAAWPIPSLAREPATPTTYPASTRTRYASTADGAAVPEPMPAT